MLIQELKFYDFYLILDTWNQFKRKVPIMTMIDIQSLNLRKLILAKDSLANLNINRENGNFYFPTEGYFYGLTNKLTLGYLAGSEGDDRVKNAILEIFSSVNNNSNTKILEKAKVEESEIKSLIFERLLGIERIFHPVSLSSQKNIQNMLSENLKTLRANKKEFIEKHSLEEYKMKMAIAKAELMYDLKIGWETNKGSTGSIIIKWFGYVSKPIAIFKPESTSNTLSTIISFFKDRFVSLQESYLKTAQMARPSAEVAAHIFDKALGLNITCPTIMHQFGPFRGSFQLFAHGMLEAQDIKIHLENKYPFHSLEIKNFQSMAILDFLLGDLDGHEKNWLVESSEDCLIAKIKKIDNANTFIQINTQRRLFTDNKQYIWNKLKIANEIFTEESRKLMNTLTYEKIDDIIKVIRRDLPCFLDDEIIALLHQRASVLRIMSKVENATPKILGELQTDEEITHFLNSNDLENELIVFWHDETQNVQVIEDYISKNE